MFLLSVSYYGPKYFLLNSVNNAVVRNCILLPIFPFCLGVYEPWEDCQKKLQLLDLRWQSSP